MNLVVLLEPQPDWIQLTNAITIKINQHASAILMLRNPAVDLGAAGLTPNDTLFLLGHGDPGDAGGYTPAELARTLHQRKLPQNHKFIVLTSCEAARGAPDGTFIARLTVELGALGYNDIHASGAVGLAISGWGVDQVVDPAAKDKYCVAEDRSVAENERFIRVAKQLAGSIRAESDSNTIVAVASAITMQVEYFYENLFVRANQHLLLPASTAIREAAPGMFRLNLAANANSLDVRFRSSLNRSPQDVRITLRDRGRVVRAEHWAWEQGNVLRVEARGDISTPARALGGSAATVMFVNPDFNLEVASITRV